MGCLKEEVVCTEYSPRQEVLCRALPARRSPAPHRRPAHLAGLLPRVCPDAVLRAVFSSKLALRNGSVRCIDQNCLNTGGAKLHAEGTGFQVNLHEGSPYDDV